MGEYSRIKKSVNRGPIPFGIIRESLPRTPMGSFLSFFSRTILPAKFERSVFNIVARHVTDKTAFRDELAAIDNLSKFSIESDQRAKAAAELYLLLERNISEEQTRGRVPRETLRGEIAERCHPERAEGDFALMFLPHYERQIALFKRFSNMLFLRTQTLLGPDAYTAFLNSLAENPTMQDYVKGGKISWTKLGKEFGDYAPPVERDKLQAFLARVIQALSKKMMEFMGELRTEVMFQEIYQQYRAPIPFVEDLPKVLLLVPDAFLQEERIALLGKAELEKELREKSHALETTLAQVQGEKLKLSELSREELEKKVQERTTELVAALTEAQEARKNLEEFSSLATHELRTPIAAMKGYLSLIGADKKAKLDDDQRKYLSQANHANERLLTLVNAMLDVSRIELGTLAIEPVSLSLIDATEEVLAELAAKISERGQRVVKNFDMSLKKIPLDPSLTHAIVINLISNAVKYTPDKGTITVTIKSEDDHVFMSVADTGFGIPKDQQPRIFEKLFRADNARAQIPEGTGLGLYLVKSILDETGGKIWFTSEESKGTTFSFTIPMTGMKHREGTRGLS